MPNENYQTKSVERICEDLTTDKETALELLAESCDTCGYPSAQMGEICSQCRDERPAVSLASREREWRRLMHGSRTVHSYGRGYLDPYDRYDKRHLDP